MSGPVMNKEEVGRAKSSLGGKWEVGEVRTLAPHLPFLPRELLLVSSTQQYWVCQMRALGDPVPKDSPVLPTGWRWAFQKSLPRESMQAEFCTWGSNRWWRWGEAVVGQGGRQSELDVLI